MLRIKLNRNKTRIEYEDIRVSGEPSISENGDTLRIPTETAINTSHNPFVHFVREDGTIYFHDSRPIVFVNKENEIYADIEPFKDIPVGISSVEKIELKKFPGDYLRNFLRIRLSSNHNNTVYRSHPISETMESPDEFSTEFFPKRCRGDYFLYSGILYRIATVHDGVYKFTDIEPINLKQNLTIYSGDFDEGVKTISCFVPVNANGNDILDELLWEISGSGSDVMEALLNNRYSMVLIEDNRFYDKGENDDSGRTLINKRPGTRFCFENGNLRVSVPIAEDFATNAFTEDAFNLFAESRKNGLVNEIIDYEKMKFTPCYRGSDNKIQLYNSIKFNINLRDRNGSEDWTANEENYWFAYNTINQSGLLRKTNENVSGADIISSLDFEDNDIYYQKNKVKNTFLRISFYNSNDRKTQQLLYSAKLYLDSGRLYGKYIKDVQNRPESKGMVVDDWGLGEDGLYVDFTCSSSYDTGNTSEGFYLYLFPSNLDEKSEGIIYMKAELNNSKYGYTIPLTLPMKKESNKFKTVGPGSTDFPIHYLKKNNGMVYPDMAGIRRDTFIPINIFSKDNKYYWEFDVDFDGEDSDDLVITLFEPRINGTENITESGGGDCTFEGCSTECPIYAAPCPSYGDTCDDCPTYAQPCPSYGDGCSSDCPSECACDSYCSEECSSDYTCSLHSDICDAYTPICNDCPEDSTICTEDCSDECVADYVPETAISIPIYVRIEQVTEDEEEGIEAYTDGTVHATVYGTLSESGGGWKLAVRHNLGNSHYIPLRIRYNGNRSFPVKEATVGAVDTEVQLDGWDFSTCLTLSKFDIVSKTVVAPNGVVYVVDDFVVTEA